ncbi:uncharacterized protein B4U80_14890 [Leptotrombidium deliense]|uniref:Endonuclease/exonuclease/phosphatase domain-containing protein n=1 Tax=Leptotrombidium deliense TaxID=299467 RepID=A0A443S5I9_9ACAR|nr:uncharacterized protein B4U80_14890 [Leptotrombidium deliense]
MDFSDANSLEIINDSDAPTFETYRNGSHVCSCIDITMASNRLTDYIQNCKIDRTVKATGDHNAITFDISETPLSLRHRSVHSTFKYNTKKANWDIFSEVSERLLSESNIT